MVVYRLPSPCMINTACAPLGTRLLVWDCQIGCTAEFGIWQYTTRLPENNKLRNNHRMNNIRHGQVELDWCVKHDHNVLGWVWMVGESGEYWITATCKNTGENDENG